MKVPFTKGCLRWIGEQLGRASNAQRLQGLIKWGRAKQSIASTYMILFDRYDCYGGSATSRCSLVRVFVDAPPPHSRLNPQHPQGRIKMDEVLTWSGNLINGLSYHRISLALLVLLTNFQHLN